MVIPASLRRNGSISVNVDEKFSFVNPSICFFTDAVSTYVSRGYVDKGGSRKKHFWCEKGTFCSFVLVQYLVDLLTNWSGIKFS